MIFNQRTLFRPQHLLPILFFLCFTFSVAKAQERSASGYQMPEDNSVANKPSIEVLAARGEAPLSRLFDYVRLDTSKIRRLPPLEKRELPADGKDTKRLQVGVVRSLMLDSSSNTSFYQAAGGRVGVIGIITEGALMTRVHFADVALPSGAKIFVYSMKNPDEFYGPYEGVGPLGDCTFWTPPVEGDGIVIEYFIPNSPGVDQETSFFTVSGVSHIYKDPQSGSKFDEKLAGACNLDVTAEWANTAKSVGRLLFTSTGGDFLCTGTLLNTTNNSQIPYLLTANHCFNTQTEAQSLRVYWNYNSAGPPPGPPNRTDGANLLVTGEPSDFTFVQLTGVVPAGLFLSGWDANPPPAVGTSITGIHHPDGDYKRISFGNTQSGSCGFGGLQCIRVLWSSGTTEGGSSGSGLWKGTPTDPAGPRLIGTLTGGDALCSNLTGIDQYGRFDVTYPAISSYLEGTNCVTSLSPTSQSFSASSGTGSINVTAPGGCNWTANSTDTFVTVTSGTPGTGNGTVGFSVATNSGAARSALVVIGGQVFTVTQSGGGACAATSICVPQTINAALATSDCPLGDDSFYDAYSFNGTAGQQVSILMTASFDTFLFLLNPDGSVLATNDDGGGGTNSRIPAGSGFITLPTTGSYTIRANSFFEDVTGPYTLTVSGTAPPPPSNLTYSTNPAVYTKDTAITPNTPSSSGGAVASYGISPALPAGLTFNTTTGVVSGTPTVASPQTNYTVTATNCGGPTNVQLTITVNDVPPSIQLEFADYNFSEGVGNAQVHVKRTGDTTGTSSVNFATGNNSYVACHVVSGSAVQNCDFILSSGTLSFTAGQTDLIINILINDDTHVEGNETLSLSLSNAVGATLGSPNTATLNIIENDTAGAPSVAPKTFIAALTSGQEVPPTGTLGKGGGVVQLDAPETSAKVGLIFSNLSSSQTDAHIHGPAAVGVNALPLFTLPLGTVINHSISPTAPEVADLKAGLHYMNVHTSNFSGGEIRGQLLWNPLNEVDFFVTQQYYDFLGRLPDQGGFDFWTAAIAQCGINVQCLRGQTVGVSNAFFYEQEYQQTASYVFLLYRASFGNDQPFPNPDPNVTEAKKLPEYLTFVRDRAQVVGGSNLASSQLALANAFVQRPEFVAKYPVSLSTGTQFVTAVLATIQSASEVDLSSQSSTLITHFNNGGRGLVMFHLANDYWNGCQRLPGSPSPPCVPAGYGASVDNRLFIDAEYNRSFVYSQYSGYLRRDSDIGGFLFWLNEVGKAPPRDVDRQHAMVCTFITSAEYQFRFGPKAPRTDAECIP